MIGMSGHRLVQVYCKICGDFVEPRHGEPTRCLCGNVLIDGDEHYAETDWDSLEPEYT